VGVCVTVSLAGAPQRPVISIVYRGQRWRVAANRSSTNPRHSSADPAELAAAAARCLRDATQPLRDCSCALTTGMFREARIVARIATIATVITHDHVKPGFAAFAFACHGVSKAAGLVHADRANASESVRTRTQKIINLAASGAGHIFRRY